MIEPFVDYLRPENGGLTVSGGEPLLQPDFVASLFRRAHAMGVTTCLDTACHGTEEDWETVLRETDYVLLCLKGMDDNLASQIACHPPRFMSRSKAFARHICQNHVDHIRLTLRWVLLKGQTDTTEELDALVEFANELSPILSHIELIPYHELGRSKYDDLGIEYKLKGSPPYNIEEAKAVKEKLELAGVKTTLSTV
jgi:pyruvate formate lyase activating enzyme